MNSRLSSYAAASVFPSKILKKAKEFYRLGKLYPHHAQISITNNCNLNCNFCSCAGRSKSMEMPIEQAKEIIGSLHALGMRALTITGGGEPTTHPHFPEFVGFTRDTGTEIGLVTNGFLLDDVPGETLEKLIWCRVSASDDRNIGVLLDRVAGAVARAPEVDWAFSYVVTHEPEFKKLAEVIRLANNLSFTHVRVVHDLVNLDEGPDMGDIMSRMREMGVDDSLVIYQGRKHYQRGSSKCLISLVKPLIGTDGNVYPCCGVQYARPDIAYDFDPKMSMGSDLWSIWNRQREFNGVRCTRCYYRKYNELLEALTAPVEHEEFV